ncbi:unnamed protein product [Cyclocybe aegerita]|uniref:Uncharacterized protein n=1 Tax=Cyclocybe aegerita TaxID=1973307 RepID=A0A8S0VR53_CYCAE|nr:unnamed protein product [Cyclocybe aegerita]
MLATSICRSHTDVVQHKEGTGRPPSAIMPPLPAQSDGWTPDNNNYNRPAQPFALILPHTVNLVPAPLRRDRPRSHHIVNSNTIGWYPTTHHRSHFHTHEHDNANQPANLCPFTGTTSTDAALS